MASGSAKISCDACGKSYAWKPQFAGRSLKCVCGATIKAPLAPPEDAPPPPDLSSADEFERAFAGGAQQDEAPPPRRAGTGLAGAIAAAGAPKARKYEVDYSGGDVYGTIRKLRFVMSLIALVVSVAAYFIIHAALSKKAPPPPQLVTYEGGQRKVYEINDDGNVKDVTDTADPNAPLTSLAPTTRPSNPGAPTLPEDPKRKALREQMEKEDKRIAAVIKDENLAEARDWCAPTQDFHAGKMLQMTDIRAWCDLFYKAGAKTVWMSVTKRGRYEMADEWVVELPDEKPKRAAVLKLISQLAPVPMIDLGNKYMMFPVDRF